MQLHHVDRPGASALPIADRPKTPIVRTITSPDSDSGVRPLPGTLPGTLRGTRSATSEDGRWRYVRNPTNPLQVTVTFLPTGQTVEVAGLDPAREATFDGTLLGQFRGEAYLAAYNDNASREERAAGQRLLAQHLRAAGDTDVSTTCHRCGGLLTVATRDGRRHVHVDACEACVDQLPEGRCPRGDAHAFCGDPDPVLTAREVDVLEFEKLWWKRQGAKEQAIRVELGMTPTTYYALLNRIVDMPDAMRTRPGIVKSVRKLRRSRDLPDQAAASPNE